MKKILLIITAIITLTQLAEAQVTVEFDLPGDTVWVNDDSTQTDAFYIGYVVNKGTTNLNMEWVRINMDIPTGWEVRVCDNFLCWGPEKDTASFTLTPSEEGEMYPHFYPNGITGIGCLTIKVFENENFANTDSIVYCAHIYHVGVDDVDMEEMKVYPNPASNYIKLTLPDNVLGGEVEIYDMTGKKVYEGTIDNNEPQIDVTNLPTGSYVLKYTDQNGAAYTARFQKKN